VPIYLLDDIDIEFPPAELADVSGIVAVGGDLRPERLLEAYRHGIFPWYSDGQPILWHSPDPRFVLPLDGFHLPRSLKKVIARGTYEVRFDTAFDQVMRACAETTRPGQRGTWITDEMLAAYVELHRLGYAHSVESWSQDGKLAGGLYGVALGAVFFGESMFARAPDASKVALVSLVEWLRAKGFLFIDCQQETEHLGRFGAEPWPRDVFLLALSEALTHATLQGSWTNRR
jgi:leucyl/phenylalanyl-tRNA---protein transferase